MNDPHVVALIYRVEHGKSVDYEEASPLSYDDDPRFQLTVEDNSARFELKEHYADVGEAREAIEPFIQHWEFETGVRWGPNSFSLLYTNAEIIDRNPSPSEPGTRKVRVGGHVLGNFSAEASIRLGHPHYPPPPAGDSVDPNDDYVVKMKRRYDQYRLGRAKLPDVAYFCVTILEKNMGVALQLPRSAASVGKFSTKLAPCCQKRVGMRRAKLQALTMRLQERKDDS